MHVGEIGVLLNVYPNEAGVTPTVNLANSNCSLVVRGPSTTNIQKTFTLTLAPDNTYAFYITQATDFPVDGVYLCQLIARLPSGQLLKGDWANLEVLPSL